MTPSQRRRAVSADNSPSERSAAGRPVDSSGHEEVLAREPADGVGRETDDEAVPDDLQLRVVVCASATRAICVAGPKAALNILK